MSNPTLEELAQFVANEAADPTDLYVISVNVERRRPGGLNVTRRLSYWADRDKNEQSADADD